MKEWIVRRARDGVQTQWLHGHPWRPGAIIFWGELAGAERFESKSKALDAGCAATQRGVPPVGSWDHWVEEVDDLSVEPGGTSARTRITDVVEAAVEWEMWARGHQYVDCSERLRIAERDLVEAVGALNADSDGRWTRDEG